jgi:Holliday junction resolvasome RuvABC ATP-dependent DNA helicase subunit
MSMALVEEVFRLSGVPTYTFVEPVKYDEIKVSLRTRGRCSVIEGPSGIGKTTTITKAINDLKLEGRVTSLSARRIADAELIAELPTIQSTGPVIVDDFHRLPDGLKGRLSDYMKVLADSGEETSKLILIGINKAGQQLVKFAHDLGMRIDVFKLEANPNEKIQELIGLGEQALNIKILAKEEITRQAQGSFQIAQALCHVVRP